ncbi:MAG: hypothetical protein IMZ47_00770, partial [Firmicutes bacterium]|nr:hypothetical protein [Bacillota bacterium]
MAIIRNPKSFTEHFGIDPAALDRMGILNPMLNVDTKLFIDPVLLDASTRPEISQQATNSFRQYFSEVITLLRASRSREDLSWRTVREKFRTREIRSTCLGYGASGIQGYAIGLELATRITGTAKEIVDLGITDPNLFKLLPLLEEGVGPDLISDMTIRVILRDLYKLTESICRELGVPTTEYQLKGEEFKLPRNPTQEHSMPVLLVPKDILRALPLASDWGEVSDVISENVEIRERVNRLIGDIWHKKTIHEKKQQLRRRVLASREAFELLLRAISEANIQPYDLSQDPEGLIAWHNVNERIAQAYPLALRLEGPPRAEAATDLVKAIIEQFRRLIEDQGLWKLLWHNGQPRNEKNSQMIFFAIA